MNCVLEKLSDVSIETFDTKESNIFADTVKVLNQFDELVLYIASAIVKN